MPTPTLTPSPPPVPTPTATPPLSTQEPPAGFFRLEGTFADMWAGDPGAQMLLGWARAPDAAPVRVVVQPFERGEMLWRADTGQICAPLTQWAGNSSPTRLSTATPRTIPR
ncbi:MAG: hypothetical protein R2854_13265 [Caldilineaceae bacterium]